MLFNSISECAIEYNFFYKKKIEIKQAKEGIITFTNFGMSTSE